MEIQERIKKIVIAGVDEIPEVGTFFGLLIELLWPGEDQPDPWDKIKEKVEQLIDQKLDDLEYSQIQEILTGLGTVANDYLRAVKEPGSAKTYISEKFNVAKGVFDLEAPHFQAKKYQLLLLPLFAQMANLHLALLRDGCLNAKAWEWTDVEVQDLQNDMRTTLAAYLQHVNDVYDPALKDRSSGVPGSLESFNRKYGFIRDMTVSVLDYRAIWPYMDPMKYPNPVKVRFNGELYSDAYGNLDNQPPIDATPLTWRSISRIQVWAGSKIDAVKVWYDGAEGPKMGGSGGALWMGGDFDVSQTGPLKDFFVLPEDALWGLGLEFEKGATITKKLMGFYTHPQYDGSSHQNPYYPPTEGWYISGITAIGPDLVRAIYFHYRYDNGRNDDPTIRPGTEFPENVPFASSTGSANLVFQSDGNLVDYDENNVARWASGTGPGKGAHRCVFESDGELVVYTSDGQRLWGSGKKGSAAVLSVQSDGNIVIYSGGSPIWSTGTVH